MKTFTVNIDSRLDNALDSLRDRMGKSSRSDVFRSAITLLRIAEDGKDQGLKLTLSDTNDNVRKEIVI